MMLLKSPAVVRPKPISALILALGKVAFQPTVRSCGHARLIFLAFENLSTYRYAPKCSSVRKEYDYRYLEFSDH